MRTGFKRGLLVLSAALAVALPVSATASNGSHLRLGGLPGTALKKGPSKPKQVKAPTLINQKALAALVKAARAEGSVTLYSSLSDSPNQRIAAAFQKKYGIPVQVIRAPGTTLLTRLSAEESAGQHSADIVMISDDPCSFQSANPSWIQAFTTSTIPLWPSFIKNAKSYLRKCADGWTYPVIGVKPWGIIYNTDLVKTPPTWTDLASSAYSGHILLPDPRVADAYYDFWNLMLQTYGASFVTQLGKNSQLASGGPAAAQSVAAGEAWAVYPSHIGVLSSTNANGKAPIALTIPSPTVGLETMAFLISPNMAPHPSAAALLMNYLLSGEGNLVAAGGGGGTSPDGYSIYHLQGLPKSYTSPNRAQALANKAQINSLLGLK